MAQAYTSFGGKVSLVEGGDRLIGREEPFASEDVREALQEKGVEVHLGVRASAVHAENGEVVVDLPGGGGRCAGEQLLVATGRKLNTTDIGLETVGLEPGKPVEVDDRMRANDWLYAVGDANGRALLTHMGKYQARVAADVILGEKLLPGFGWGPITARDLHRPTGRGGRLHPRGRPGAGLNVRVADVPTQSAAGASFYGRDDARGTARLVVDEDRRVIVGATFTGPEVAEFLQAATVAVIGEVPLERLFHAIPAFPTRSEVWLYLLEQLSVSGPCYPLMTQQVTA